MFKPSSQFAAAALAVALMCAAVNGAPVVPPNSIAADTQLVIHVDATHFNPGMVDASAKALLITKSNVVEAQIAKLKERYDEAVRTGIEGITLVIGDEIPARAGAASKFRDPFAAYLELRPGADVKAAEALLTSDLAPADRENVMFEQRGKYLVMHERDIPLPTRADAGRADAFAQALSAAGDSSVQVALILSARMKPGNGNPDARGKGMEDVLEVIGNSKWTAIAVELGDEPRLTFTVNAADANAAKRLSDAANSLLDVIKKGFVAPEPGEGAPAPHIEDVRPTTRGTLVTIRIEGPVLAMQARFFFG